MSVKRIIFDGRIETAECPYTNVILGLIQQIYLSIFLLNSYEVRLNMLLFLNSINEYKVHIVNDLVYFIQKIIILGYMILTILFKLNRKKVIL